MTHVQVLHVPSTSTQASLDKRANRLHAYINVASPRLNAKPCVFTYISLIKHN